MNRLAKVQRLLVPSPVAQQAHAHLKRVGRRQVEGVALWAGQIDGRDARITTTIIPLQTALRLPTGLVYVVDDEELHRLNVRLYREGLTLVAQLHSHPEAAYHSETDDTYPIATAVGSVSVVVPTFARGPINPASWAVYRLTAQGWTAMAEGQSASFIQVYAGLMAIAPFFDKAALGASQVLQGFDFRAFQDELERQVVAIAFDGAVRSHEGRATLELTANLIARLYPRLTFHAFRAEDEEIRKEIQALVRAINPEIDIEESLTCATTVLVVGNTRPELAVPTFYLGSDGWLAKSFPSRTCRVGRHR